MHKKILWGVLVWGALASFGVQAGNFAGRPYKERWLDEVPIDDRTGEVTKTKWLQRPQPTGRLVDFVVQLVADAAEDNSRWHQIVQGRSFTRQQAYVALVHELVRRPDAQTEPLASTLPYLQEICSWVPGDFVCLRGFRLVSDRAVCLTSIAKILTPPATPHQVFSVESTAFQSPGESDVESFSDDEDSGLENWLDDEEMKEDYQEEKFLEDEPESAVVPAQRPEPIKMKRKFNWRRLLPGNWGNFSMPIFIRLDRVPNGVVVTPLQAPQSFSGPLKRRRVVDCLAERQHNAAGSLIVRPFTGVEDEPACDLRSPWLMPLSGRAESAESSAESWSVSGSHPDAESKEDLSSEDGDVLPAKSTDISRMQPMCLLSPPCSRVSSCSAPVSPRRSLRQRKKHVVDFRLSEVIPAPRAKTPTAPSAAVPVPEAQPTVVPVDNSIRIVSTDVVSTEPNTTDVVLVVEDAAKPGVHEAVVVQQRQGITFLQAAAVTGTVAVAGLAIDYVKRGERSLVGRLLLQLRGTKPEAC